MFVHVLGASLVLGMSWLAFGLELSGRRRNDSVCVDSSRVVSKAIVLIYATIGSLGTAITVELFVLWPNFVKALTVMLWSPFVFVAAMILSNFLLIAVYWYTYDKMRASLHLTVGFFMALTSSLIPLNFRTIIAFTNQSVGETGGTVDAVLLYTNPSLPPLYTHTIFASLSTAGFIICGFGAGTLPQNRKSRCEFQSLPAWRPGRSWLPCPSGLGRRMVPLDSWRECASNVHSRHWPIHATPGDW